MFTQQIKLLGKLDSESGLVEESRMIIQHNIEALNSMNCFGKVNKRLSKSTEKLSSGYKINRAADDAAGLTISEKMRWQIRGLNRASRNINDGISYCNVAEGALGEIHSMLGRMKELSVQAANDTNTDSDRDALDKETQQLKKEIDKIFEDTMFNTQKIWCADYIPSADGNPTDFSFYNIGSGIGGIEYMNHRYSWDDLGIDYDKTTNTFTKTKEYTIDQTILKNDSSTTIDDYSSKASFKIKTVAGKSFDTAQKTYSWHADTDGIAIDGIITKGTNTEEGNTTWSAMGLTAGNDVKAGRYKFNYFGMDVSFDVKENVSWTTFVDGINNPRIALDWHSDNVGAVSKQSADILRLKNNRIIVDKAHKDRIQVYRYDISAEENKLGIKYFDKTIALDWKTLADKKQQSGINSWGINNSGNDKTDIIGTGDDNGSSKVTIYDKSEYVYDDTNNEGIIGFDFVLDETGSMNSILYDLENSYISATTVANTKASVSNSATVGDASKNTNAIAASSIDFITQRDVLGRQFNNPNEAINTGKISIDSNNNTVIKLNTVKTNTTYDLSCRRNVVNEIANSLKAGVENLKKLYETKKINGNGNGIPDDKDTVGSRLGYLFENLNDSHDKNTISVDYDFTGVKYADVKNFTTDQDYLDLAKKIFEANSDITVSADGDAYQDLSVVNKNVNEARIKNGVMVDGYVMDLYIQSGALGNQGIDIQYAYMRASNLGLGGISLKTSDDSSSAINQVDKAIDKISEQRSIFGAYTNRLEYAYNVNNINSENTQAAESRIRDTDMAKEMAEYSKNNILSQVGQSILAQSNQNKNQILQLLQ